MERLWWLKTGTTLPRGGRIEMGVICLLRPLSEFVGVRPDKDELTTRVPPPGKSLRTPLYCCAAGAYREVEVEGGDAGAVLRHEGW